MQDSQYQIEVALRLALASESDKEDLNEFYGFFTMWMDKFESALVERCGYPQNKVAEQFRHIRSFLEAKGVYLPSSRNGWQSRARRLLTGHGNIEQADSAGVFEALCSLGDLDVLPIAQWASKETVDGVHLLLKRLLHDLSVISSASKRTYEGNHWEWDGSDSGWTNSAANQDFGYAETLRAISNVKAVISMPTLPTGATGAQPYIRYWFSLSAVVVGHLGWREPATGLAAWINNGMPEDNAIMSAIKKLWGLDAASLLAEPSRTNLLKIASEVLRPKENESAQTWHYPDLDSPKYKHSRWFIEKKAEADKKWGAPNAGGWDPLHLTDHVGSVLGMYQSTHYADQFGARLLHSSHASYDARASLIVESGTPWYSALTKWGDRLSSRHDGRSWRVEVVSKDYGYIGEFRRSSVTGLWFTGKHSSHMLGNSF